MKKVRPSEVKRKQLEEILNRDAVEMIEDFHRIGQETLYQEALEAEVDAHLGRSWYQRDGQAKPGYRNGYYRRQLMVPGNRLEVAIPRVRNTRARFRSRVLRSVARIAERVKTLALEMYVRGLSTRDVEQAFVTDKGEAVLSRSAMSRLAGRLYDEYLAFAEQDLSQLDVVFLFVDGVYEAVRRYTNGQALLCAWAICADGTKRFLHLAPVQSETQEAWELFFEDMQRRGLRQPLLVISDGAPGLIGAITHRFPKADRQRCIAHKLRNLLQKLPKDTAEAVVAEFKAVYYAPDRTTADALAEGIIGKYASIYPAAVQCFSDDLDACLTHLKYPEGHRRYIRTTNMLERTFEEQKRRTKILPQHQNERGAIGLVFGVLHRASQRWLRVSMTPLELIQLRAVRDLIYPKTNEHRYISCRYAA
jgi:transposase-like protein